ncbi:thioredoxin family protein [Christiangramia salexigens]|uniref:Thioredoxin family protein n=1 Tax=Christiangramia salexigens TaxID=1913577 RepID=A0A1L3J1A0_9FLAO|nr:thioredoxin family protein [Christiangramia salexigens]APG58901.1 thioredoxin family protein [Christiangramia salexigens]APG61330.1 thioredoxin family protein [Christiangramia salexigens]
MSLTPSNMLKLGTKAPDFRLMDAITDHLVELQELKGEKGTLIMFICNHCPFVKHVDDEIVRLANDYRPLGFNTIGIMSNDIENYPQDRPEMMKEHAMHHQYSFPYLFDGTQEVARAYDAACTPDFFLFDDDLKLVYRGQLDDSRPGNGIQPNGRNLREAMDAILNNRKVSEDQKPSIGCNIKWKN